MLEKAFKAKDKVVCDVDNERFVNLDPQDLYQARKDAPDRRRMVRRGDDDQQDADEDDDDGDNSDSGDDDNLDSEQEHDESSDGEDPMSLDRCAVHLAYPSSHLFCKHNVTGKCLDVGTGDETQVAGTSSDSGNAQVIKWFWGTPSTSPFSSHVLTAC